MGNVLKEKEFNLLYEPWILVKTADNKTLKLSLLEVYKQASNIQQLAGELPTQDIAILRLLLAIMYGAFVNEAIEDAEDALKLWKELWSLGEFPYEIIENYLKQYEDRFWLFHPKYPFYQVAGLNKGTEYDANKLIGNLSESKDKVNMFSDRSGINKKRIEFDEATRWLLQLNAFDDASGKPTRKRENMESPGVGWLGKLGIVYIKDETLFKTMMLNFVLTDYWGNVFADNNNSSEAYWEQKSIKTGERILISQPKAQKQLLTLQSRRILLKRENGFVVGFQLLGGDFFDVTNALEEQMTLWRQDEKTQEFFPEKHKQDRQVWRDMQALLSEKSNEHEPGVLRWVKYLKNRNIAIGKTLNVNTVGIEYDSKNCSVKQIFDDSITINSNVLGTVGEKWIDGIIRALDDTDTAVNFLGYFIADILIAAGDSEIDKKNNNKQDKNRKIGMKTKMTKKQKASYNAREMCYSKLDPAFRKWLREINPDTDNVDEKIPEWKNIAKKIIKLEGRNLMDKCSDNVLVGYIKTVKDKKGNTTEKDVNLFVAFNRFVSGLTKTLG